MHLVIDNKVYYRVNWNTVEKLESGKWLPGVIEDVKGTKTSKLPDHAQGSKELFGGYIEKGGAIVSEFMYKNPIRD